MNFLKKILCVGIGIILLLTVLSGALMSLANETTASSITMKYCSGGVWKDFVNGKAENSAITGVWIQTTGKSYYLHYRTYSSTANKYYDYVNSNDGRSDQYAGVVTNHNNVIMKMDIQVFNLSGEKISTGIVVMYRSKIGDEWGKWASNASLDWMNSVKRKYRLEGEIDKDASSTSSSATNLSNISGLEIKVFEETSVVTTLTPTGKSKIIDMPNICQNVKYPSGCESVSAVMALNYAGVNVTPEQFIDVLPKSNSSNFHPDISFGGDPYKKDGSYGCYPPVICNVCDELLKGTGHYVRNETGANINYLCEAYIDSGIPVIFWATSGMQTPKQTTLLNYNGTSYYWVFPEHCLVLVGYDDYYYIFNDPQVESAKTYYLKSDVERAYAGLKNRAVVIMKNDLCPDNLPEYTVSEVQINNPVWSHTAEGVSAKDGSYTEKFLLFGESENTDTEVSLSYNTKRLAQSCFGCGFYCDLLKNLNLKDENTVLLYENPSEYVKYEKDGNGDYVNQNADKSVDRIVKSRLGFVRYSGNKTENYGNSGRLVSSYTSDNSGYSVIYTDSGAVISDMTSDAQFVLTLDGDGFCTSISDGGWNYGFFYKSGYLIQIVRNGMSLFELRYNDSGVLYSITDGDQNNILALTFDDSGKTVAKTDLSGDTLYTYGENTVTTETDGEKTVYGYNEDNMTVGIVYGMLGDVNRDGFVNLLDFVRLKSELASGNPADFDICDINSDGFITALDFALFKNYLLGGNDTPIKADVISYNL